MNRTDSGYVVHTDSGDFGAAWVINSAGLYADQVARLAGICDYTIYPCRGEYFILDRQIGSDFLIPAYPVPNPKAGGLGIHLTPTVDGNIMIGPSAEYVSAEAEKLADTEALYIKNGALPACLTEVCAGAGIAQVVPQKVCAGKEAVLSFRVKNPVLNPELLVMQKSTILMQKQYRQLLPAVMEQIRIPKELFSEKKGCVEISLKSAVTQ